MPTHFRKRQTPITQRMAEDMLVRNFSERMIPFGKRPRKLLAVLGQHAVHDLIQCVEHPKHRTVLLTLYAAGLRRLARRQQLRLPSDDSERSSEPRPEPDDSPPATALRVLAKACTTYRGPLN